MIVTSRIALDICGREMPPVVHVMQDDKYSRNLQLTLFKGGISWNIPEGTSAVVRYCKPDGTGGTYDTLPDDTPACAIEGYSVTVAMAPQVCTVPGIVRLSIALTKGEKVIHTFPVRIDVTANPGLQVSSQSYFKISGALADSGWTPNMYLGTDPDGNVVVKDAPSGSGGATDAQVAAAVEAYMANHDIAAGATEEQAAQIRQNADDIKDLQDNALQLATDLTESGKAADAKMVGDALMVVGTSSWEGTLTMAETVAAMSKETSRFDVEETETGYTITETMVDGGTNVLVITKDANDYPVSMTLNGREIPVGWSVSS